jgi:hypothetical protein
VNGGIAPKSIVVEVADLVSQWGRQNHRVRQGECPVVLPGFVPPACRRRISGEQGRSVRLPASVGVGSDKPIKQGRPDGLAEVRLVDSTLRSGEPITWGSGQRRLSRFGKHRLHLKGGYGLLCKEKRNQLWKRNLNE